MDIYEYEMDFCKAADICRIITRITGRELYHGDTQYNYDQQLLSGIADSEAQAWIVLLSFFTIISCNTRLRK